jgi:hypothetical protein
MPFKLRKAPGKELYWVVESSPKRQRLAHLASPKANDKGKHYSDKPMAKTRAEKQLVALRINYRK